MSAPIGIGIIGLGESGQHHIAVIQGDRVHPQPPPSPEKLGFVRASKRLVRRVLDGRRAESPRPPDPGIEDLKIIAASDLDEGRLAWATQNYEIPYACTDYQKLLSRKDIEAVLICTPPAFHPQITAEAVRRGKHIFCEKPMAMTSAGCLEMLEATEKAGVIFQVGYMLRFCRERARIAEAIRNNEIGRPVFFREIISLRAGGDQRWIHEQETGGGPLWEVSHGIDFLRYVFGDPEVVFGIGGRYKPNLTSAFDTYAVSMNFPSGDRALLSDSYALKNFGWDDSACRSHRTEIDVMGPKGYMQFPDADLADRLTICAYGDPDDRIEKSSWTSIWGADEYGYKKQLEHFIECVRAKKRPDVSGYEGLRTIQLAETILDSIRTGEARRFEISREAPAMVSTVSANGDRDSAAAVLSRPSTAKQA
jgi:predicted dehydrogenase